MSQSNCANPQLLEWVKEWYDTARERSSKGITTYKHAYDSLKACPIEFEHPSQLQQLKGFGPKLCDRLTQQLSKYRAENGLPMPEHPSLKKRPGISSQGPEGDESGPRPAKKPKTVKAYVPAYRSGPYALLLTLSTHDKDAPIGMTKVDLIEEAQQHCDASFTAPADTTKFYTAWNSMKTLLQKELVYERGRPLKRYALTEEGLAVAKRIKQTAQSNGTIDGPREGPSTTGFARNVDRAATDSQSRGIILDDEDDPPANQQQFRDVITQDTNSSESSALPAFTPFRLEPGSFSVQLVLDVREVRAKTDRDYMQDELAKKGVKPIMRSLDLGDAMWVAKCNDPNLLNRQGAEGDEVVLDYIVERKRLDDLITSIKDGRFHEQKFRLRRSGIRNVIYLVEEMALDSLHFQKYEEAVQSAIASTQVVNGYFLKKTQTMDDSIRYLTRMTMLLKRLHENKPLDVIPTKVITAQNYLPLLSHIREKNPSASYHVSYPAFASLASKSDTMTLRDIYLKMLMCTKGVTGEKAVEIQKRWRTPYDFVHAFEQCGAGEEGKTRKREMVFKEMANLVGRKKIGKSVSQKIAEVWGDA